MWIAGHSVPWAMETICDGPHPKELEYHVVREDQPTRQSVKETKEMVYLPFYLF